MTKFNYPIAFTSWDIWQMFIVIVCKCDITNFEIYLGFLDKPFFYMTKNSEQKRAFKMK